MRAWIVGLTFSALQVSASAVTLGEFAGALAVPATANYSANNWNALKPIKGVKWRDATLKEAPSAFAQEADVTLDGHGRGNVLVVDDVRCRSVAAPVVREERSRAHA